MQNQDGGLGVLLSQACCEASLGRGTEACPGRGIHYTRSLLSSARPDPGLRTFPAASEEGKRHQVSLRNCDLGEGELQGSAWTGARTATPEAESGRGPGRMPDWRAWDWQGVESGLMTGSQEMKSTGSSALSCLSSSVSFHWNQTDGQD